MVAIKFPSNHSLLLILIKKHFCELVTLVRWSIQVLFSASNCYIYIFSNYYKPVSRHRIRREPISNQRKFSFENLNALAHFSIHTHTSQCTERTTRNIMISRGKLNTRISFRTPAKVPEYVRYKYRIFSACVGRLWHRFSSIIDP